MSSSLRQLTHAGGEGDVHGNVTPARIGLAMGLCLASGFATSVGALTPFFFKAANSKFMAFALGVSSGVMLYVSFVELFAGESMTEFSHAGFADFLAYRYSTLTFFGGMLFMWFLDKIVHFITHKDALGALKSLNPFAKKVSPRENTSSSGIEEELRGTSKLDLEASKAVADAGHEVAEGAQGGDGSVVSRGLTANSLHNREHSSKWRQYCVEYTTRALAVFAARQEFDPVSEQDMDTINDAENEAEEALMSDPYAHLGRTGLLTALAIGIHNVPEGLATFISTLASVKAGGALAVAIAIHNIPEGVAVSMPFYYATGSKFKALLFGTLAGFPLPVGGLIAYAIVSSAAETSPLMFGLLFGLVGGMMVAVVFMEILPNAYLFDPRNVWVGRGVALGFAIMAASLLLFGVKE